MSSTSEEYVVRLDVSVHQSVAVQEVHGHCQLGDDVSGQGLWEGPQLGQQRQAVPTL